MILGIDEAGRGPWAGPLVMGAVVLGGEAINGLTDSKKLSKKRREELDVEIRAKAEAYALGWVSAAEIDEAGLSGACELACRRALEQISVPHSEIIIDGTVNFLKNTGKGRYVTTMKKADLLVPSVSAASIIAKVARDRHMKAQDELHPGYGFGAHAGYGTAAHRAAIARLGISPLHRLSYAPLQKFGYKNHAGELTGKELDSQTTKRIGDRGELAAAAYLEAAGHEIVARNWRTRFCEIDIVSMSGGVVYFNEVKYRKDASRGGGIAAITPAKLRRMRFAAELYVLKHRLTGVDMRLAAIDVSGTPPEVAAYLEID